MSNDFSFLKDNIELIILNALYGGDKYGYEISKEILEKTDGRYEIKQPTLYSYLKRLELRNQITSYWGAESNGGRRRYYALSKIGKQFCEQTSADWLTRKSVMDTLVMDNVSAQEHSDEKLKAEKALSNVTKFENEENKRKRVRKEKPIINDADRQNQIGLELDKLLANPSALQTEKAVVQSITPKPQPQKIENPVETFARLEQFEIVQEKPEDFIKQFNETAQQIYSQPAAPAANDDGYKHLLDSILSQQMDDMQRFNDEQSQITTDYGFVNDRPLALEEVANQLAKDGIRMRIYNSTTAVYRSKELFPVKKVYCLTAWLTILAVVGLLTILCLASLSTGAYTAILVSMALLLVVPIAFTFAAFADPVRKDKPNINFKTLLTAALITSFVVILLSFGINILFNLLQFSDSGAVVKQIGIPCIISLTLPLSVLVLKMLFVKYSQ